MKDNKLISMVEFVMPINGFSNYLISNEGLVIRVPYIDSDGKYRKGRVLSHKIDKAGYHSVCLFNNRNQTHKLVHRLVACSFVTGSENLQVNHKDGDKSNNNYNNLEWCTDKENKEHSVKNGLNAKGIRNGKSKLTESEVRRIKDFIKIGDNTQSDIGLMFNIHPSVISDIKNNRIWKHIN